MTTGFILLLQSASYEAGQAMADVTFSLAEAAASLIAGCGIASFVQIVVCSQVSGYYKVIPQEHRAMAPSAVWFNVIPLVPVFLNFVIFPGLASSFEKAFRDKAPDEQVGDCGKWVALWYCISVPFAFIPCVNWVAGPVALLFLVLSLYRSSQLARLLTENLDDLGWGSESGEV